MIRLSVIDHKTDMRFIVCLVALFSLLLVPTQTSSVDGDNPPIIDVSSLIHSSKSHVDFNRTVAEIISAAQMWGFFTVVNHGIDLELTENLLKQAKYFFNRSNPEAVEAQTEVRRSVTNSRGYADLEYTKQRVDAKQVFDVGHKPYPELADDHPLNVVMDGHNQWPSGDKFKDFRTVVSTYYDECSKLSQTLIKAIIHGLLEKVVVEIAGSASDDKDLIAESSNIIAPSAQSFINDFHNHTSFLRLNYYPVTLDQNEELPDGEDAHSTSDLSVFGVGHHTDSGGLTLLLQGDVSGLEVYSGSKQVVGDGHWVPVRPVPGGITVNIADMLQVYSNDRLKAAEHRVRASRGTDGYCVALAFQMSCFPSVC